MLAQMQCSLSRLMQVEDLSQADPLITAQAHKMIGLTGLSVLDTILKEERGRNSPRYAIHKSESFIEELAVLLFQSRE